MRGCGCSGDQSENNSPFSVGLFGLQDGFCRLFVSSVLEPRVFLFSLYIFLVFFLVLEEGLLFLLVQQCFGD